MSSLLRPPVQHQPQPEPDERPYLVGVLGDRDRAELVDLADEDPIVNAVVGSRLHLLDTVEPRIFGGQVLGARARDGRLTAAVFHGGNLLPMGRGPAALTALGEHLARRPRICSSVVGRADAVGALWRVLQPAWAPVRAIRAAQPLLMVDASTRLPAGDPRVTTMRPRDLEAYLPAASAMFTEELGVSPQDSSSPQDYRRRVAALIRDGRAFGILDAGGKVAFKADVGAISAHTCQVQGVWVRPDLRGQGLATAALAAVLRRALTLAPTVSLYVNDFNVPARRVYDRLGMRQVATLSTVLF